MFRINFKTPTLRRWLQNWMTGRAQYNAQIIEKEKRGISDRIFNFRDVLEVCWVHHWVLGNGQAGKGKDIESRRFVNENFRRIQNDSPSVLISFGGSLCLQLLNKQMSEEAGGQTINMLSAKEPDSQTVTKNFKGDRHSLAHQNRLQVQKTDDTWGELEIRNHIAAINGQKVVKLTEIQFHDRIVKIIDSFTCTSIPPHTPLQIPPSPLQHPVQQNTFLIKDLDKSQEASSTSDGQEEVIVKDTKNLVKGVVKMFQCWVKQHSPPELQLENSLKYFVNTHGKYNHKLIVKLSRDHILRKAFISFCDTEGEYIISTSNSKDKNGLISALRRYHNLCLGEEAFSLVYAEQEESFQSKKSQTKRSEGMDDQS